MIIQFSELIGSAYPNDNKKAYQLSQYKKALQKHKKNQLAVKMKFIF